MSDIDVAALPRFSLDPETALWRIHPEDHGPWWFPGTLKKRFSLEQPEGTCHVAGLQLGSAVETFGRLRLISRATVEAHRLTCVHVPSSIDIVDITERKALGAGVTATLSSGDDYSQTQAFARAVRAQGFGGIQYRLRHDPAQRLLGIAIFGPKGKVGWPADRPEPIPEAILERLQSEFGLVIESR